MEDVKWVDLYLDNGEIFTLRGSDVKTKEIDNELGVYINKELKIEERFVDHVRIELKGYMDKQKYLQDLRGQLVNKVTIVLAENRVHYTFFESKQPSNVIQGAQQIKAVV